MHTLLLGLALAASTPGASPPAGAPADRAVYEALCAQVAATYDSARGGFVDKQGVPIEGAVELAFRIAREGAAAAWQAQARRTLDWTWTLFDSVGGGFFQSPADADPKQASFNKRTDANARRLETLIDAWRASGEAADRRRCALIVDYFDRVLLDGRGGFVAGQFGDRELVPEINGLAIHAWLRWAAVSAEPSYREFAYRSLDRLWGTCWNETFGLLRKGTFGEVIERPQLIDQCEAGRAYLLSARLTGRDLDLQHARVLGDLLLASFQDPERGGFRTQAVPDKKGGIKAAARDDAENARAARFLCELSTVTGDPRYREAARRAWRSFDKRLGRSTASAADWALAIRASFVDEMPAPPAWKDTASPDAPSARRRLPRGSAGRR